MTANLILMMMIANPVLGEVQAAQPIDPAVIEEAHDALSASARALWWHWKDPDGKFLLVLNKRLLKVPHLAPASLDLLVERIVEKGEDWLPALRQVFMLHVLRTSPPKLPKTTSDAWNLAFRCLEGEGTVDQWSPWSPDQKTLTAKRISMPIGDSGPRLSSWWHLCRDEL